MTVSQVPHTNKLAVNAIHTYSNMRTSNLFHVIFINFFILFLRLSELLIQMVSCLVTHQTLRLIENILYSCWICSLSLYPVCFFVYSTMHVQSISCWKPSLHWHGFFDTVNKVDEQIEGNVSLLQSSGNHAFSTDNAILNRRRRKWEKKVIFSLLQSSGNHASVTRTMLSYRILIFCLKIAFTLHFYLYAVNRAEPPVIKDCLIPNLQVFDVYYFLSWKVFLNGGYSRSDTWY